MSDESDSGNSSNPAARRRGGLGRGLDSLIPTGKPPESSATQLTVPVDAISANPWQPRSSIERDDLESLADSIRIHGLLQPLIVMRSESDPSLYTLIAGERRWRASRQAGLRDVPVVIKDVSSQEMLELALVENVVRADLSPIEEAHAYRQLIEEFGLTQAEVAVRVSRSRVTVTNTLRLLTAPTAVQDAVQSGEISEGHARALLALPSGAEQLAMLEVVVTRQLSVRQTEEEVRRYLRSTPKRAPNKSTSESADVDSIRLRLERSLTAPVQVKFRRGGEAGVVEIAFHSQEEMHRIVQRLAGDEDF